MSSSDDRSRRERPIADDVPVIAEHDSWVSVDPLVGCPAGASTATWCRSG